MPLVMGVDSSTQSTKVEVRDADDGTLVASARASHRQAGADSQRASAAPERRRLVVP